MCLYFTCTWHVDDENCSECGVNYWEDDEQQQDMERCDRERCRRWYHYCCAGYRRMPSKEFFVSIVNGYQGQLFASL